jgi:hypothetical protein
MERWRVNTKACDCGVVGIRWEPHLSLDQLLTHEDVHALPVSNCDGATELTTYPLQSTSND